MLNQRDLNERRDKIPANYYFHSIENGTQTANKTLLKKSIDFHMWNAKHDSNIHDHQSPQTTALDHTVKQKNDALIP